MTLNREIPSELSHEAEVRWREFCKALDRADLVLPRDAVLPVALNRVFAFSDFVARNCVRVPQNKFDGQSKKVEKIRQSFLG